MAMSSVLHVDCDIGPARARSRSRSRRPRLDVDHWWGFDPVDHFACCFHKNLGKHKSEKKCYEKYINNKMNGMLLEGEALSHCAKSMSAMIDDEASFERILMICSTLRKRSKQDVQSRQALVICLAMQKDPWSLRRVLRLPCPLLTCFRFEPSLSTAAPQFTRVVWVLLRAL
jgi:hypothetical protein